MPSGRLELKQVLWEEELFKGTAMKRAGGRGVQIGAFGELQAGGQGGTSGDEAFGRRLGMWV